MSGERTPVLEPVRHVVRVKMPPADAFSLFTRGLARWWPLRGHSCGGDDALDVEIEEREGGAVTEVGRSGARHLWGTLLRWQPPVAFAMTWHPGRPPGEATRLLVEFHRVPGGTEVRLFHDGWEARGEAGAAARRDYDGGWPRVLAAFAGRAQEEARS